MLELYSVLFYTNDVITKKVENISMNEAYNIAAPQEAYINTSNNRWHLMLRTYALTKLKELYAGETLRVAWQNHVDGMDRQHILIKFH